MVDIASLLPTTGQDFGVWGEKYNDTARALNQQGETALAKATAAETPAGAQAKADAARDAAIAAAPSAASVTAARDAAIAASEPRLSRTGAAAGWVATLNASGGIVLAAPTGGSGGAAATATTAGAVRLTGDLGGTSDAPTTPTAVHKTGAESIAGVKTFSDKPAVPADSFPTTAVVGLPAALTARALLASVVVGTLSSTRPAGGAFAIFGDPTVDPGASALVGDFWVGDVA